MKCSVVMALETESSVHGHMVEAADTARILRVRRRSHISSLVIYYTKLESTYTSFLK